MVLRVADRAAAVALVARLRAEPSVGAVRSVLDLDLVEQFGGHPPAALRAMVEAEDGSLAVWAAPREEVWSPAARDAFAARMLAIDPHATGMPVLGAFIVERSRRALVVGGLLGALVLVGWVLFDLRSLRWSLLALAPTGCTAAALGPAMVLLGLEWNPIDVIALPVVLGIAVDDGIHLVHRYRAEGGNLAATLTGTGRGVVLTSLTTLAAFLSLAFASHPGLASFAAVVSLGVAIALISSLVVLPGLLVLGGNAPRRIAEVG